MAKRAIFGVAGNPPNFWKSDFRKERANSPQWLKSIGFDALEIQCTYGVRMPRERIKAFLKNSKKYEIKLFIHAPYYIALGSKNPEKINNSINELHKAFRLAHQIGSQRVIFHLGTAGDNRKEARNRAITALMRFEKENKLRKISLFPEIAGKVGQLGSFEDIISICEEVKIAWPCLDLAHLHAREHGSLRKKSDFARVIDLIEKKLGKEVLKNLHIHFYPVDFGLRGELSHKAFFSKRPKTRQLSILKKEDNFEDRYFPRYEPFLELMVERGLYPTIICEAKDSQDLGAREMKKYYLSLIDKKK